MRIAATASVITASVFTLLLIVTASAYNTVHGSQDNTSKRKDHRVSLYEDATVYTSVLNTNTMQNLTKQVANFRTYVDGDKTMSEINKIQSRQYGEVTINLFRTFNENKHVLSHFLHYSHDDNQTLKDYKSSQTQILDEVKVPVRATLVMSSTERHIDQKMSDGNVADEEVTFVFLNDNDDAYFSIGDDKIPVIAGNMVSFIGSTAHQTVVNSGEVRLLGPFTSKDLTGVTTAGGGSHCDVLGSICINPLQHACLEYCCIEDDLYDDIEAVPEGVGREGLPMECHQDGDCCGLGTCSQVYKEGTDDQYYACEFFSLSPSISPIPTYVSSSIPSSKPTNSFEPSPQPSPEPSAEPSSLPTLPPTSSPTHKSTLSPSLKPSQETSSLPTAVPFSPAPSPQPSEIPTAAVEGTQYPSLIPTCIYDPTAPPTEAIFEPSSPPTVQAINSFAPSVVPTNEPSKIPTGEPTTEPTTPPTKLPTLPPTDNPTTSSPNLAPTMAPTTRPTNSPSLIPTANVIGPTFSPTSKPTTAGPIPTTFPTTLPTTKPTPLPTMKPSAPPTRTPTMEPTNQPTKSPTAKPTIEPTPLPTKTPTLRPTEEPTKTPTLSPTTEEPSRIPTPLPTPPPTPLLTIEPTPLPTQTPSAPPTRTRTMEPTNQPTKSPTAKPTVEPTPLPTKTPTARPTTKPTKTPSLPPTSPPAQHPTISPTQNLTSSPTFWPTPQATIHPSTLPTSAPSCLPTPSLTEKPSLFPTASVVGPPTPPPTPIAVTSFSLIDSHRDDLTEPLIKIIQDGQKISEANYGSHFNIRANTEGDNISHVRFALDKDGNYRTEIIKPYMLAGDTPGKDIYDWEYRKGRHNIKATPYFKDENGLEKAGVSLEISVVIIGSDSHFEPEVTSYSLINTQTNKIIKGAIKDGDIISEAEYGDNLSIRANTVNNHKKIQKVSFYLNGHYKRSEAYPPYALAGDIDGNYSKWHYAYGEQKLKAIPELKSGSYGIALEITFTIVSSSAQPVTRPTFDDGNHRLQRQRHLRHVNIHKKPLLDAMTNIIHY